jgi:hypothetical protein
LYDWLCNSENSEVCHSRSSTVCTNSRIIGDTLRKKNDLDNHPKREKLVNAYLSVSTGFESAVLVGFVPLSKLNDFGLSECGEAVVELAIHSLESHRFCIVLALLVFVEEEFDELLLLLPPPPLPLLTSDDIVVELFGFTWPRAIAMGLGEESGDDVRDDTCEQKQTKKSESNLLSAFKPFVAYLWYLNLLFYVHT